MKYCKKCGSKIDDDSMFCGNCGASQGEKRTNESVDNKRHGTGVNNIPEAYQNPFQSGMNQSSTRNQSMARHNVYSQTSDYQSVLTNGRRKNKNINIIKAILVLMIVIIVGTVGYKLYIDKQRNEVVEKTWMAFCNYDTEEFKNQLAYDEKFSKSVDEIRNVMEEMEDELGTEMSYMDEESFDMYYKADKVTELYGEEKDNFWKTHDYGEDVLVKKNEISAMAICKGKMTIEGKFNGKKRKRRKHSFH